MAEEFSPPPVTTVPPVVQPPVAPPIPPPPPPKRGIPKKLLLILGILALFGILIFLGVRLLLPQLGVGRGEAVTITWWGLWEDDSVISPILAEYQTEHPNVTINYVKQSQQQYRERLANAFAKGEGPDIFRFHNTWTPMFKQELDILPSSVMAPQEFTQSFYPIAASDLGSGTGFLGIPLEYDGLGLFINEEIFETAGKSPPKTWDDLRETAVALTIKDENGVIRQAGAAMGRAENIDHWQEILALMMLQNGTNLAKPNECSLQQAQEVCLGADALEYFTVFSSRDGIWDATLPASTQAFAGGKLAMYLAPSWRVFEIREASPSLRFRVVPVPQLPKNNPDEPDITYATYWVEGVWKRSQQKEVAWDILKFVSSKASLEKMYQSASKIRLFGEPYPRADMREAILSDPVVGGFITLAPQARSWYLASRTFDGPTGINTQISKYFEDAVNAVNNGEDAKDALDTAAAGINQVLTQYGLATPIQPETR